MEDECKVAGWTPERGYGVDCDYLDCVLPAAWHSHSAGGDLYLCGGHKVELADDMPDFTWEHLTERNQKDGEPSLPRLAAADTGIRSC